MDKRATVKFLPGDHKVAVEVGTTLLEAALSARLFIPAQCGGTGACGKCAVRVVEGNSDSPPSRVVFGADRYREGLRLACRVEVVGDMAVEIPGKDAVSSMGYRPTAVERTAPGAPAAHVPTPPTDSPSTIVRLHLTPPAHGENMSDSARLVSGIARVAGGANVSIAPVLLKEIPELLRRHNWDVTVRLVYRGHDMGRPEIFGIAPGDKKGAFYAVACDIGTTTLWVSLLDIETGTEISRTSAMNPQIAFGTDVISRIVYAQKAGGARKLQRLVVESIDLLIGELLEKAGRSRESVTHVVAAGNSVMSHLLLGLPTKYLREAPYVPVAGIYPEVSAKDIGFALSDGTPLFVFPSVASYVGGDIVAGVLASGFFRDETITLFIDIGTNGEIALGNDQWMLTASASAGPAFEGAGVRFGTSALPGAVEGFIAGDDYEPMITTIGRRPPVGICGSGIINTLSGLFMSGVIDPNGKIRGDIHSGRVREGTGGMEYVLVWGKDSATGEDIVIDDVDIENVIRAKAAMFAGYRSLTEAAGIGMEDIRRVVISGAFGNVLDVENAVAIGLLPDIDRDRFIFIGNGSLSGAMIAALSRSRFREGLEIARGMTNVELSVDPAYLERYLAAVFLPHTDIDLFPTVKGKTAVGSGHKRKGGSVS